jgi:hypothetical protein
LTSSRVLVEEVAALRAGTDGLGKDTRPGSPWTQDEEDAADRADPVAQGRAVPVRYAPHQISLVCVGAWDHVITLGSILGGDGARFLFSRPSSSRAVCAAAVWFAWFMNPDISSAKRRLRAAVPCTSALTSEPRGYARYRLRASTLRRTGTCSTAAGRNRTGAAG